MRESVGGGREEREGSKRGRWMAGGNLSNDLILARADTSLPSSCVSLTSPLLPFLFALNMLLSLCIYNSSV